MKIVNSPANRLDIVVSGSHGLVGHALCEALRSDGHRVRRLVRRQPEKLSIDEVSWDPPVGLHDPQQLSGCDCLVHLAGHSIAAGRWNEEQKRLIRDSRVLATRQLADQLLRLEAPPQALVCASAVGLYGDQGSRVVDEQAQLGDDFLAHVARDWEAAAEPLASRGTRVVHARLGIVLDRHDGALAKMLPIFRWAMGGRLGAGTQYWSWVSLRDCVSALQWLLADATACGPYNVVSPNPVTNQEFTHAVAAAVGKPAVLPAPSWMLRLAMGEMADALLLCSCRAIPRRLQEAGFSFRDPDLLPWLRSELS